MAARASGTGNHEVIDATIVGRLIDPQEGLDPRDVSVPVVKGRVGVTILPLLSQVKPSCSFTEKEIKYLTKRIQDGGTDVVQLTTVLQVYAYSEAEYCIHNDFDHQLE
ncbi:malate dehydrogenase, glyoxysomal [Tanacetum coccineum]